MTLVKSIAIITGFTTLLALTPVSLAQNNAGVKHGRYQEKIIAKLNLNEHQQGLLSASREQMRAGLQQRKSLRREIKAIVQSDSYDDAAIAKLADQLAAITRSETIAHSSAMHEFYQSLNTEQRAQLAQIEQQRAAKRKQLMQGS
jgi:Spy/CpxP family protein refolding chaperone